MRFAPEYVTFVLNENFEDAKALLLSPLMAIHYAHLVMLAERDIVSAGEARALRDALDRISQDEIRKVKYDGTCEDLFFYIDRVIIEACGDDVAGRLHTARSRNDIDMTMYRMRQREFVLALAGATFALRRSLLDLVDRHRETILALHTHTQLAQPSTVAHYLLAVVEQLERDWPRLKAAYERTNRNPLGACAITGTGFPIDRQQTSELLASARMRGALAAAIERYDIVLVDSPPMFPVADASLLATMVDGVVLVVRGERTPRHLTREAIARLRFMQAKVLGVVLNGVNPSAGEYAYRYSYYFQDAAGA